MEVPMLFFPHDIIEQTLLKLPTKSLLRFKCVRKSWPDLISTHKFAIKHLTETSERFRRFGVFKSGNLREGCISVYSLAAQAASHTEEAEEETICLPLWGEDCCLAPAANEYIINRFIYTRVLGSCNESDLVCGYVYNLKTNSWKRLQNLYFPYKHGRQFDFDDQRDFYLPDERATTLVTGAPHWVTYSLIGGGVNKIIYFDLEEEKFKEFLSRLHSAGTLKTYLSNYEDCLCEIRLRWEKRIIDYTLEVWIMKEYGVNDSRIKLLNLPFDLRFSLMSDIRPLFQRMVMKWSWLQIGVT
ncbi:F-box/kelch-repeat protein At3g23880-like [Mangifera indica]|uniref:F-box/kelch-repeat protein At3g23880-like n=1 Tax=Mangifera indica TaxID=29780 RepID=UPI001CFA7C6D|nr:F-box/kelch-repeat protein At3g23880-like [Mangifera indica]